VAPGPQSKMRLEWVPLEELATWPGNPKEHDLDGLGESLDRFGYVEPICFDEGTQRIVAGHGRLEKLLAKKAMGQPPPDRIEVSADGTWCVPVVRGVNFRNEHEAEAYLVTSNQLVIKGGWNDTELAALMSKHTDDLPGTGWTAAEVEKLIADADREARSEITEDEVPELPKGKPVSKLGDVWTLGKHRLICGDALTVKHADRFGAVLADPPYGIAVVQKGVVGCIDGPWHKAKKGKYTPIAGDGKTPEVRWLIALADVVTIWGGNYFADQLPPVGGWLIWDKRVDTEIQNNFADAELAWSNRPGPARIHRQLWNGMIRAGESEKRQHPTQKPVALMAWCLGFSEGTVLDPFAGSGSTLIAAEQLGRSCTSIELSPEYCDVIVERWERLTSGKAKRTTGPRARVRAAAVSTPQ